MKRILSTMAALAVCLSFFAFTPAQAVTEVNNVIVADGECAGSCYTNYQTSTTFNKCDEIWTEEAKAIRADYSMALLEKEEDALAGL